MVEAQTNTASIFKMDRVQALLIFLFLFPLFFQLSGSLYLDQTFKFDSHGQLSLLPLPIALIFCFIGIGLLLRLEKQHFGMGFLFSVFVLLVFSTIMSAEGIGKAEFTKFIQLIQFILPMFAFIFGRLYLKPKSIYLRFEALALYMLLLVIPLEVVATLYQDTKLLSPYLYLFSLYQHLQYLPVIFVGLYFLTIIALYEQISLRYLVLFLAPWVGFYLAASMSTLAVGLAVAGSLLLVLLFGKSAKRWYTLSLVVLFWTAFQFYLPTIQATKTYENKYGSTLRLNGALASYAEQDSVSGKVVKHGFVSKLPNNLQARFYYWEFYGKGVLESPKRFLFGHQAKPNRALYPSAHNYYLDLVYNFGVVSILPFVYLIFFTIRNCQRVVRDQLLTSELVMLVFVVGFYVIADNSLKVGFRQPYPGMIMFFLWGVLLATLPKAECSIKSENTE